MAEQKVDPRVKDVLDRRDELVDIKRGCGFDEQCQKISDLILPSRDFTIQRSAGELRTRFVRDATGILSNKRLAAFLYGDMLSPAMPWVTPKLLSRDANSEEAIWFERSATKMHARLSGPASPIATQLYEAAQDATAFGNNATFRVRKKGELPRVRSVALANSYWGDDGEDVINVFYRDFTHTAREAAKRYPSAKIIEIAEKNPRLVLNFTHATEPREGGVKGARGSRKPFTCDVVWREGKELVEAEQGYDRFPFQVGRFERSSGHVYGQGPGWHALPAVWSANAMAESIVRAAELQTDPILFGNAAVFGGRLDRRPGAFNPINNGLGTYGRNINDLVGKIEIGGDVGIGMGILENQRAMIERFFYVDWLWLREGPMMTATEVNARRQTRMQMMAPVVARLEQEWLNPLVEEVFFAMLEGGFFDPPPASLANEEIGFEYRSPLALAQQGAMVEAIERTFDTAARAAAFDETAKDVLKSEEMLRDAALLRGVSAKRLNDVSEVAKIRAERAARDEQVMNMQAAQAAASTLQQGAQGLASLKQAQGGDDLKMAA